MAASTGKTAHAIALLVVVLFMLKITLRSKAARAKGNTKVGRRAKPRTNYKKMRGK